MSPKLVAAIMPTVPAEMYSPLVVAMLDFKINTAARQAAFLANVAVESRELGVLVENLNYSSDGLARTWPSRYALIDKRPNDLAKNLARKGPQAIANNVYANRMGNGDESSGDGWRYRGSGGLQESGKTNQLATADFFGVPAQNIGDWLRTPEGACRSAARRWQLAGCNELADAGDFDGCCDKINLGHKTEKIGDAIGYAARLKYHVLALNVLGVTP